MVVGCGANGGAISMHLARCGVPLRLIDRDLVELSNLPRQILFSEADALDGAPKALAAVRELRRIDSQLSVNAEVAELTVANVERLLGGAAIVVDGTDNLETRLLINDWCVQNGIPWVYCGSVGRRGMFFLVRPDSGPCFRCLFRGTPPQEPREQCAGLGVLAPTVGLLGAVAADQALRVLAGHVDDTPRDEGRLHEIDLELGEWSSLAIRRRPDCPCCGRRQFSFLQPDTASHHSPDSSQWLCGGDSVLLRDDALNPSGFDTLRDRARSLGMTVGPEAPGWMRIRQGERSLMVFADGRVLIRGATDLSQAQTWWAALSNRPDRGD